MSADDRKKPGATQFVTDRAVQVRVRGQQPTPPAPEEKVERAARTVVRPPASPREKRDAFIRRIVDEHGARLLRLLHRPRINPASAEEMRQELYIVLDRYLEDNDPPEDDEKFLARLAENQRRNHARRRGRRLPIDDGAEADDAVTSAPDPERELDLAERRVWLDQHLDELPRAQAEAVECVDRDGLSLTEAAAKLGRSRGTISTQRTSGLTKLKDAARDSERAAEAGERRRPGK